MCLSSDSRARFDWGGRSSARGPARLNIMESELEENPVAAKKKTSSGTTNKPAAKKTAKKAAAKSSGDSGSDSEAEAKSEEAGETTPTPAKKKAAAKKPKAVKPKDEPPLPRAAVAPTAAGLESMRKEAAAVLADLQAPEEPKPADLIAAFLHLTFAAKRTPCHVAQQILARIESEFVDRNEYRVTEAFEIEEMLAEFELPNAFEVCLAAKRGIDEIYNDQNGFTLDFLREASVTDRNMFFQRVPSVPAAMAKHLVHLVSFEEIFLSERSTQRVQQRLGLEPKDKHVESFITDMRTLLKPFGHLPLDVAEQSAKSAKHQLCPTCTILRLGPEPKGKK